MTHPPKPYVGSILAAALLLAATTVACGAPTVPIATPTPEPSPTATPEPSAWLLGYGDEGFTLYEAATGERVDLSLPPLWKPDLDLRDVRSSGLLAARVVSDPADPADLALAILRLPEGDLLRRIPLFWMTSPIGSGARQGQSSPITSSRRFVEPSPAAGSGRAGRPMEPRWPSPPRWKTAAPTSTSTICCSMKFGG